jgi:catechol 2,3-dioxygenase-like lactoylglutathione lyase family enzyme
MISTSIDTGDPMTALPRVQLALNVSDVDAAVAFYTQLFGSAPHKQRPGYANFALESPPLKLVLIENPSAAGSLNHLGVEVDGVERVAEARVQIDHVGLSSRDEDGVVCCHARQDKVWVDDPDGRSWEFYTITDDNPDLLAVAAASTDESAETVCCAG